MKKELTNDELLNFNHTLSQFMIKDIGNVRFKYAIIRNAKMIADAVDTVLDIKKPSDSYNEYQQSLLNLANKYCEKKEGNLVLYTNDTYLVKANASSQQGIPKPKEKFKKHYNDGLEELKEKHKQDIEDHVKKVKEFNVILTDKVKIDVYALSLNDAESAKDLTYAQMIALSIIIDDNK